MVHQPARKARLARLANNDGPEKLLTNFNISSQQTVLQIRQPCPDSHMSYRIPRASPVFPNLSRASVVSLIITQPDPWAHAPTRFPIYCAVSLRLAAGFPGVAGQRMIGVTLPERGR